LHHSNQLSNYTSVGHPLIYSIIKNTARNKSSHLIQIVKKIPVQFVSMQQTHA